MSRFLSAEAGALAPYTPGEQPKDQQYLKLNANENPFPPSPEVVKTISQAEAVKLNLYPDAACNLLHQAIADYYGLQKENVIAGNGSDEILSFALRAFCGEGRGVAYADITYSFYQVWVKLYGLEATIIPLREDLILCVDDYMEFPGTVIIANPNAPTGLALPRSEIRRLLEANRERLVIVDEAYVDFGGESCASLVEEFDNLLVVQTMSKSRSLAGARVGFALGCPELIADLNRIKYSNNPYNINHLSMLAGAAAMRDTEYFDNCCRAVCEARDWTKAELETLGFTVLPSCTNFLFARPEGIAAEELYRRLKENGVLIRWFDADRIRDHVRITVGTMGQMKLLVEKIRQLLTDQE